MTRTKATLRDLLVDAELTVTAFAERVGVSRDTAHTWLRGEHGIRDSHLKRVSKALGVTLEEVRAALEETAKGREDAG